MLEGVSSKRVVSESALRDHDGAVSKGPAIQLTEVGVLGIFKIRIWSNEVIRLADLELRGHDNFELE